MVPESCAPVNTARRSSSPRSPSGSESDLITSLSVVTLIDVTDIVARSAVELVGTVAILGLETFISALVEERSGKLEVPERLTLPVEEPATYRWEGDPERGSCRSW